MSFIVIDKDKVAQIKTDYKFSFYKALYRTSLFNQAFEPIWRIGDTIKFDNDDFLNIDYSDTLVMIGRVVKIKKNDKLVVLGFNQQFIELETLDSLKTKGVVFKESVEKNIYLGSIFESRARFYEDFQMMHKKYIDSIKIKYSINDSILDLILGKEKVIFDRDWRKDWKRK